jgi:AraC-like DNA-binding protein
VDAAARLVGLLAAPRDVPALAPLVLREVAYRLLAGSHGRRLRQMAAGDGQARRVGTAVGWLRAHFREPLRVAELARRARMSPSAFHAHFKAVTALSPLQYQKRLRLEEARRLLLGDGLDAAEAGFRVGYASPTQFSREYRRLFGAPPARDAAARRAGLVAAG